MSLLLISEPLSLRYTELPSGHKISSITSKDFYCGDGCSDRMRSLGTLSALVGRIKERAVCKGSKQI